MGAANDVPLAARLARLWRPSGSTPHRRRPGRAGVRSGLKPARQRVLSYIATVAVKGAGAGPQGGHAEAAVRVALEHGVEEADRGAVLCQLVVGIVEVLAGLGYYACGVVVEVLVLVAGDDPARGGRRDGGDCPARGVAASPRRDCPLL